MAKMSEEDLTRVMVDMMRAYREEMDRMRPKPVDIDKLKVSEESKMSMKELALAGVDIHADHHTLTMSVGGVVDGTLCSMNPNGTWTVRGAVDTELAIAVMQAALRKRE